MRYPRWYTIRAWWRVCWVFIIINLSTVLYRTAELFWGMSDNRSDQVAFFYVVFLLGSGVFVIDMCGLQRSTLQRWGRGGFPILKCDGWLMRYPYCEKCGRWDIGSKDDGCEMAPDIFVSVEVERVSKNTKVSLSNILSQTLSPSKLWVGGLNWYSSLTDMGQFRQLRINYLLL